MRRVKPGDYEVLRVALDDGRQVAVMPRMFNTIIIVDDGRFRDIDDQW